VLFREHEPARTLYVLETGALEVVKKKGDGEIQLWLIPPGESFGEMSFIDMQPRSASVRALEPSTVWMWHYTAIHERYSKDTKSYTLLVMNVARELSRRLRRADELIVSTR
jgi:CRP-like cAMP-binding protein